MGSGQTKETQIYEISEKYGELLTNGLIRESIQNMSNIYPIDIIRMILLFCKAKEKIYYARNTVKISDDQLTITQKPYHTDKWAIAYGNIEISSMCDVHFYWKIQINHLRNAMFVGVSTNRYIHDDYNWMQQDQDICYHLYIGAKDEQWEVREGNGNLYGNWISYSNAQKDGDIITIELDLKRRQIGFHVNDENCGVAFDNVYKADDVKYHLAMAVIGDHTQLTIVEYGEINVNKTKKNKC